jgi:hypothetical protein
MRSALKFANHCTSWVNLRQTLVSLPSHILNHMVMHGKPGQVRSVVQKSVCTDCRSLIVNDQLLTLQLLQPAHRPVGGPYS